MNYKIICDDRDIEFTNNHAALSFYDNIDKNFYRVNDDIIEVEYKSISDINGNDLKTKYKIIFIILRSIQKDYIKEIDMISKYNNVIISVMNRDGFSESKNFITLNGLNEKINVEALLDTFSNEEVFKRVKNRKKTSSIIIGNETLVNSLGNISRNILINFGYIQNYKDYMMCLYSNKDFNLQETADLEDLIREYSYTTGKVEIEHIKDNKIEDSVFYSILATK